MNYLRNHWTELTRYLEDPKLSMGNNECEQLMKQVAIGRKDWLFAGSVVGGERNAGFLTLVSSAHRNDLDVYAYVNDTLTRLLAGETNYESMLPWHWGLKAIRRASANIESRNVASARNAPSDGFAGSSWKGERRSSRHRHSAAHASRAAPRLALVAIHARPHPIAEKPLLPLLGAYTWIPSDNPQYLEPYSIGRH